MKKIAFITIITLLSINCIFSQSLRWELDEEKSYSIPIGLCTWEDLMQSDFYSLVRKYSMNVILNSEATVELAQILESKEPAKYEIEAYFGAWDDESLQQLPHFYAFVLTMESKYQKPIAFRFIGCNREYDCGGYEEPKTLPYFKLYQLTDNQRTLIGEISEKPTVSFEDDVLNFIKH
ncbi:MAG: hypothetical protein J5644_11225 [Bacteroidales bacterium]|nr:hypothetical protein [Bacteroidales bacterium]